MDSDKLITWMDVLRGIITRDKSIRRDLCFTEKGR